MANIQIRTDDLSGDQGAQTVRFGLDGKEYTIDLAPGNEARLREFLAEFVEAGSRYRKPSKGNGIDPSVVRSWAMEQGLAVADRGRLSAEVVAAFQAAQAG